jgi:O-antigen/teichoic acid export membrane protein
MEPDDTAAGPALGSLKERATKGALFVVSGNGARSALRLLSNLILTRLLFPEAFGLMALVQVSVTAIEMSSDLGFRGSVVQNSRADARFLNTVWTVKVLRGLLVSLLLVLAAPVVAGHFEEPLLAFLIPVTGTRLAINGLASTSMLTLLRRVEPGKRIALMFGAQVVSIVGMLLAAIWFRSVWVLVFGDLLAAIVRTVGSHFLISGYRNRFAWDRAAVRDVFSFGRWIWVSSIMTGLLGLADRAVLGNMMSSGDLGVYAIALALASMIVGVAQPLSGNLLFPVFSSLARSGGEGGLRRIRRARGLALAALVPPLCFVVIFAPWIVELLYDDRYADAGPMLRILAAGTIPQILVITAERGLLAFGDSFRHMALQIASAVLFVAGLGVGASLGGAYGLMVGGSVGRLLAYIPYAVLSRKYGFTTPVLDLSALAASGLVCVGGLWMFG